MFTINWYSLWHLISGNIVCLLTVILHTTLPLCFTSICLDWGINLLILMSLFVRLIFSMLLTPIPPVGLYNLAAAAAPTHPGVLLIFLLGATLVVAMVFLLCKQKQQLPLVFLALFKLFQVDQVNLYLAVKTCKFLLQLLLIYHLFRLQRQFLD